MWRRRILGWTRPPLCVPTVTPWQNANYMHLVAAKKGDASVIYTLNMDDFQHLRRGDDPEVLLPS